MVLPMLVVENQHRLSKENSMFSAQAACVAAT
jgi:hypothetical protein